MKKKFIIPLSVAAMTLVSVTAVSAAQEPAVQPQYGVVSDYEMVGASESATYGQFKYSVNSKNEAIIEGLSDEAAAQSDVHLIIPAKINGYNVTEIENSAFKDNVNIKSVTFSEGLKKIGGAAFSGCVNLTGTVTLPSTLTSINYDWGNNGGAFSGTSISKVVFKDGTDKLTVDRYAFSSCKSLTEVSLPSNISNVGPYTFDGDSSLEKVTFKDGSYELTISDNAFRKTAVKNVTFPKNTIEIGAGAFDSVVELTSITLNEGLKTIGSGAFEGCNNLSGKLVIPSTVETIGSSYYEGAFERTSITSVEFKDSSTGTLLSIYDNTFKDCKMLESVSLPNRVKNIASRAFANDTNLSSVEFKEVPANLTIGDSAFYNTAILKNIYYSGSEKDYSNYVTISFDYGNNKEYQNATLTYNYTAYDTWAVPKEPDKSLNGLAQDENGVWKNYKDGKVDTEYTGLVDYNGTWIYVEAGEVNWGYTGLVDYNGMWFYVSGGVIDWNYEGIADYAGNWFYVTGGMINWDYTGLTCYSGAWFYVSGGVLDWSYTGLAYYNGIWFYVSGGMVDWSYSGLVYYNGAWFAVSGGTINWSTTLVEYNGMWFYVSGGMVDWDYTGTYVFYGNTFNIVGGVVVW